MDNILYPNHRYTRQGQGRHRKSVKKFAGVLEESRGKKIINGVLATGIVLMICYLCVFFTYHAVLKPLININNIEIHFQEKLDIDMQKLDLEISALTTEYDTVKQLINNNVEKTFTMFSS